ncbi:MAG: hypothetical protein AUG51_09000 [Acidobacteria bacterium 13_1_20CM_3_53_8]|nr:MAG: hypothetical protein AUG51_09000 [Acidobacteria bacterium 13_1_20CM_3_53_8]
MIRLYLDEDAQDRDLVRALALRGIDLLTANKAGLSHRPDAEHLAYAAAKGRALYSFNTGDYIALHSTYIMQGMTHAGIILAKQQRYSVGEQMRRLLRLIHTVSAEEMRDRIEFLSAWG